MFKYLTYLYVLCCSYGQVPCMLICLYSQIPIYVIYVYTLNTYVIYLYALYAYIRYILCIRHTVYLHYLPSILGWLPRPLQPHRNLLVVILRTSSQGPERLSDILGALSFLLRSSGEKAFHHSDLTRLYAYIPICSIYLTNLAYIPN